MSQADDVIKVAESYVGTKEKPDNDVIFNTWYYGHAVSGPQYPWCVAFLWAVFTLADLGYLFYDGQRTAYAPTLVSWFHSKGQWTDSDPKRGDICFIDHGKDGIADHAGLVVERIGDSVRTVEGNTSGGTVAYRVRKIADCMGFGRPLYKEAFEPYSASVRVSDYLNVRTGPGLGYPIMTFYGSELYRLPDHMTVRICEEIGSWGRLEDIQGWVSLHYVRRL